MQNIAVWNTAFLGDAVLTLPLLQNITHAYPNAKIDFWVRKGLAPLFSNLPYINNIYEFDKRGQQKSLFSIIPLIKEIKKQNYDCWISPHTSLRSALVALGSKIPTRISYKQPTSHFIHNKAYTHYVDRHFPELPEIERLNALLMPLHIPAVDSIPNLYLPKLEPEALELFCKKLGFTPSAKSLMRNDLTLQNAESNKASVLGIHPGSTWGTKQWLPEYFAKLATFALNRNTKVIIFAGHGEEKIAEQVHNLIINNLTETSKPALAQNIINLAGKLSLTELAHCLQLLDAYVCNDSGTMHIAWSLATPTFGIFGPTTPALGFAPRGKDSYAIEVHSAISLGCRPCSKHGPQSCPLEHHNCMKMISPEQVWNTVVPYLSPANF